MAPDSVHGKKVLGVFFFWLHLFCLILMAAPLARHAAKIKNKKPQRKINAHKMCKQILENNGGEMKVEKLGQGMQDQLV